MKLKIGFSPCPNDTFIFDALVNNKIDTDGYEFIPVMEDVQTLNEWALEGKLPVTKLSYGVLPLVTHHYKLLNSGSALGRGVGPLLISKPGDQFNSDTTVAVPGINTTANLLFSLAYPDAKKKIYLRYDEIEDFVLSGGGAGVIIHENRFTYEGRGLVKIQDLGDFWETSTGGPIPLGGIVISNKIELHVASSVDRLIRQSIEYAYSKYPVLNDFIRDNAQEMSDEVMRSHIDLYVNNYSLDLGDAGRKAVLKLMEISNQLNPANLAGEELFISSF